MGVDPRPPPHGRTPFFGNLFKSLDYNLMETNNQDSNRLRQFDAQFDGLLRLAVLIFWCFEPENVLNMFLRYMV